MQQILVNQHTVTVTLLTVSIYIVLNDIMFTKLFYVILCNFMFTNKYCAYVYF